MPNSSGSPFPWAGLILLAAAAFVSVTSEFLPAGLLPELAADFAVSESRIGLLITIFAGVVVLTATPLSVATLRYRRKDLVIFVLIIFAVANVLAALAPSYWALLGARIIGGLAHGLFWSVVIAYSGYLVPKHQIGRAVALSSMGGSAAFVLGVPAGTAIGHLFGWRVAFLIIAGIVLVLVVAVARFLPPVSHGQELAEGETRTPMRADRTLAATVTLMGIVVLIAFGHNVVYAYIAPFLLSADFGSDAIPPLLFVYGLAGLGGLLLSGSVGSRFPRASLLTSVVVVAGSVVAADLVTGEFAVLVAVLLWGLAFGGVPPMLQSRMLHTASPRIRDTASAWFASSFNFSIGGGALVGGIILDTVGITALPIVAATILGFAVALIVVSDRYFAGRGIHTH